MGLSFLENYSLENRTTRTDGEKSQEVQNEEALLLVLVVQEATLLLGIVSKGRLFNKFLSNISSRIYTFFFFFEFL